MVVCVLTEDAEHGIELLFVPRRQPLGLGHVQGLLDRRRRLALLSRRFGLVASSSSGGSVSALGGAIFTNHNL